MLTLHKGPAAFGVSDISPFCLKLETYLRMAGIVFSAFFPPVVGKLVTPMIRRGVTKAAHTQGLARHRPEEILEMGKADVSAVAAVLGDKPFLLGEHPTSFDAALYAFIASILAFPVDSPLHKYTQGQQNLVRYCERIQQRYFAGGQK
jgi:glutathione S-transferase